MPDLRVEIEGGAPLYTWNGHRYEETGTVKANAVVEPAEFKPYDLMVRFVTDGGEVRWIDRTRVKVVPNNTRKTAHNDPTLIGTPVKSETEASDTKQSFDETTMRGTPGASGGLGPDA